jgi:putative transposase
LANEIYLSLLPARMIRSLKQVIPWRGKPAVIRCDYGQEYVSSQIQDSAENCEITLEYIQHGQAQQNA